MPPSNYPESVIIAFAEIIPEAEPISSNFLNISIPSITSPNTTCLSSSHVVS